MDETGAVHNSTVETEPPQGRATRHGLDPAFQFVPLLGWLGFFAVRWKYPILDDRPCFWIAGGLCFVSLIVLRTAQDRAKERKSVQSFFPITTRLAYGPALMAAVLLLNGVLDRSPVERHDQVVADKRKVRGRFGSMTYYLEVTSWRANRSTEELEVSGVTYGQFRVNDAVTIEIHKGALALPRVTRIR